MFDISSVATFIGTIVLVLTLVVLIWQVKAQIRALKQDAYQRCQSDYSSIIRLLVENPELTKIYDDLSKTGVAGPSNWVRYSTDDKRLYNYLELNYELFERVYLLRLDKWIDDSTWAQWNTWLKELAKHPLFKDIYEDNRNMFDKRFQDYIDRLLCSTTIKQS